MTRGCEHIEWAKDVLPSAEGCEACLREGGDWVHLRACLTCGHVGCCDSSKGKHARGHFAKSGHPLIQSYQPGETWRWCYRDEEYLPDGAPLRKSAFSSHL